MDRPPHTATLLAALLVVVTVAGAGSAVAATVGTETPHAVTVENHTVGRLTVPDATATGQRVTADLSSALAIETKQVQATLEAGEFRNAFSAAPNRSEKRAVVEATLSRLEARAAALRDERHAAIRAFVEGELSSASLFRELARIHAAANAIETRATVVETVVQGSTALALSENATRRLAGIEGELVTFGGPVTDQLMASLTGTAPPQSIGLKSAETGVVFTTIESGRFLREATLWSARAGSGVNQFAQGETAPLSRAYQRARELYPWAVENLVSGLSVTGYGELPIYAVELSHSHGDLETYLDGRTRDVFYEVQRLTLSRLPTRTVATNTTGGVTLQVNATAVGPAVVTVRNATSGQAVIADITVTGESLTRSTIGSRLWLLETGAERTITARRPDGTTVTVTVET